MLLKHGKKAKKYIILVLSLSLSKFENNKFIINVVSVICLLSSRGFEVLEMNCIVPTLSGWLTGHV